MVKFHSMTYKALEVPVDMELTELVISNYSLKAMYRLRATIYRMKATVTCPCVTLLVEVVSSYSGGPIE